MSIRFGDLTRRYGPGGGVSGVSADIGRGTLCAVVGGNGAGKTTLLRCLAGLSRYDGEASIAGRPPGRAARGAVAYLPQALVLPPLATVGELVGLFARVAGRAPEVDRELVTVGPERMLGGLSGGELRRVAMAALLAMRPAVFLLDEPLADLDRAGRAAVLSRIRSACDLGATALVSSPAPELTELGAVVDRVLVLERGSLVADGPVREIVAREGRSA